MVNMEGLREDIKLEDVLSYVSVIPEGEV